MRRRVPREEPAASQQQQGKSRLLQSASRGNWHQLVTVGQAALADKIRDECEIVVMVGRQWMAKWQRAKMPTEDALPVHAPVNMERPRHSCILTTANASHHVQFINKFTITSIRIRISISIISITSSIIAIDSVSSSPFSFSVYLPKLPYYLLPQHLHLLFHHRRNTLSQPRSIVLDQRPIHRRALLAGQFRRRLPPLASFQFLAKRPCARLPGSLHCGLLTTAITTAAWCAQPN
ncbi:hypothetical protein PWT90_02771 [Aphanocladium album]|nr:hypothetical protein PWT90_02771 [Aphanocladium album]